MAAPGRYDVPAIRGQQLETIPCVSLIAKGAIQPVQASEFARTRIARQDEDRKIAKWVCRPRA